MNRFKVRVNMRVHAENEAEAAHIVHAIMRVAASATLEEEPKLNNKWKYYKIVKVKVQPCRL